MSLFGVFVLRVAYRQLLHKHMVCLVLKESTFAPVFVRLVLPPVETRGSVSS